MINIIAISGSLRARSTNTRLVERVAAIAGAELSIHAPQSLIEILTTMSGLHVDRADVTIDLQRNDDLAEAILLEASNNAKIQASLAILSQFIIDRDSVRG